jgi:E3 ubiquitin-protein ligase CBL
MDASPSQQRSPQSANNVSLNLPSNWANNASLTSSIKVDKKHFDKVNKLSEKLLKLCQAERMNLINSPPYIIDILPDLCQAFNTIYFVYETKLNVLNEIDYFCLLIKNCLEKFQIVLDLFKVAGKRMYEETSAERQQLTKHTLTFSHILAEIKSLFPRDLYEGQNFRIAKRDAADFWKTCFGDRIIVSWREFEIKLNRVHPITGQSESESLRETIQLTKTKFVSIFEFDIFTR